MDSFRWLGWILPELVLHYLGVQFYYNILLYVARDPNLRGKISETDSKYNVVTFVIDSMSQLNFYRSLPKTAAFFESSRGIMFKKHHKVCIMLHTSSFLDLLQLRIFLDKLCWTNGLL